MSAAIGQAPRVPYPVPATGLSHRKRLFFLVVALTYGYVLSQLPHSQFMDFNNYLVYADGSFAILIRNALQGPLAILSNEPIWLLLNAGLGLVLNAETVVRTIIFFSASSVAWLILRHHPQHFVWLVLFLLLPQVIKNFLIHLRQGAAIAVFLWGWYSVNRTARWLLVGLTPLVHASFFFVLLLLWLTWVLKTIRFGPDLRSLTFAAVGAGVSVGLGFLAQALGARQAEQYAFNMTDVSGIGFLLWIVVLAILLTAGSAYLREHAFESGLVVFYLATYWLIEVTARIFESGLILVLLSGLELRGWRKHAFLAVVLGAGSLAWLMRTGQPALGFADG